MKILHRYILVQLVRNLVLSLVGFTLLFLIFDFFDRIDNIVAENASVWTSVQYFLFKVPLTVTLMLPVAMLALILNETLVPYATRRVKEIYNIDIRQKDKRGGYSQNDLWWREGNRFYSVDMFDSRTNTLHELTEFEITERFEIGRRTDAERAVWVDAGLGWNMKQVTELRFTADRPEVTRYQALPLPIGEEPEEFYEFKTDPQTMSFRQLRRFIREQARNGISITGYIAELHGKIAFPFISFVVTLIALPFALKPARSGSLAVSFLAGLIIGFTYYAVDSFSIAMGRAELWPPVLAAWMANLLMGFVGFVLNLGAEAP